MIKVRRKIRFARRAHGVQILAAAPSIAQIQVGRVPRVSRLMALAIHFDRLIREATVKDITELARLAHVTQPRMTQIMNLNHLAPDIQEELLFLPPVTRGRDRLHEKRLRLLAAEFDWQAQRCLWDQIRPAQ